MSLMMCNNDPQGLALFCECRSAIIVFFALGANPFTCVLAPAMFMLFSKAYPCIIDVDAETCPFSAPSVGAWRAVAVAVTDPVFPVPKTSGYFSIAFATLIMKAHTMACLV